MSRSERRHHDRRVKAKAQRIMLRVWRMGAEWVSPRAVGIQAGVHCRGCSCWMCTCEKGTPKKQEMIADDDTTT